MRLDEAIAVLADSLAFAKPARLQRVLDAARRVLLSEGGCHAIEQRCEALEAAGLFAGTDWASPQSLVASLTPHALTSTDANLVVIETISELRLLAVARGHYRHPLISAEQAHHFLVQVLATNLTLLFMPPGEAQRVGQGRLAGLAQSVLAYLAEGIGFEHIIDRLIEEIWRILQQRPIQTGPVRQMITQIALCQANPAIALVGPMPLRAAVASLLPDGIVQADHPADVHLAPEQETEVVVCGQPGQEDVCFAEAIRVLGATDNTHVRVHRFFADVLVNRLAGLHPLLGNVAPLALDWNAYTLYAIVHCHVDLDTLLRIWYEDLVEDPHEIVRRVCEHVGVKDRVDLARVSSRHQKIPAEDRIHEQIQQSLEGADGSKGAHQ